MYRHNNKIEFLIYKTRLFFSHIQKICFIIIIIYFNVSFKKKFKFHVIIELKLQK